ncbi:MAG: glycoside hydrolase family 88 protein [Deltaproteobacteria bacterium]|nr:glycoside hydrolase family 88 protein [Deltaproteobacteria bacterium]
MKNALHIALRAILIVVLTCAVVSCASDDDDESDASVPVEQAAPALKLAEDLAATWMHDYDPEAVGWSWDQAILMLGIWDLYDLTGREAYRDYVAAWLDHHIDAGYAVASNDAARVALRVWRETGAARHRAVVDEGRAYIFTQAPRLPDGSLARTESADNREMLADKLFTNTFLLELAETNGDEEAAREAVFQFEKFAEHLRDPETGLYHHLYRDDTGKVLPADNSYWGRANGWIVAASGLALATMSDTDDGYAGIRERYEAQLGRLRDLMHPSGRWPTIVNRSQSYLETSVGPLMALGIYQAHRVGLATEDDLATARAALAGALAQVVTDQRGETLLLGTSFGTGPAASWQAYNYILNGEQVSYGVGLLLQAVVAQAKYDPEAVARDYADTDETYIAPPTGDDPTEWGYFHLARGNFREASASFEDALSQNGADAGALWGATLIDASRLIFEVVGGLERDEDPAAILASLLPRARSLGETMRERMGVIESDDDFSRRMERFVITEMGGSMAIGAVEVDLGEAYLFDALGRLLVGVVDIADAIGAKAATDYATGRRPFEHIAMEKTLNPAALASGLREIARALDKLMHGIRAIDAETDDQSDDLIPANLLALTGEFKIPGLVMPTPVDEILAGLGLDAESLFGGEPMPQALLDRLGAVRRLVSGLADLVQGASSTEVGE